MDRSSQRTLDSISLQLASLQGTDIRRFLGSAMSMVGREANEITLFIGENALHPAKHLLPEVKQVEVRCHLMHADFLQRIFLYSYIRYTWPTNLQSETDQSEAEST
jgi:hypothetical protein